MTEIKITPLANSEIELVGEIPVEQFNATRASALAALNQELKIDGFRAGHVPEKVLLDKVGEERLLLEMAERALATYYPALIREHNLDVIGRPEVTLTKLAKDNPLGFKIKTAVHPDFKLPDYRQIATAQNAVPVEVVAVSDEEVETVIKEILQSRTNPETKAVPELTDELVKTLGDFADVAAFKNRIKNNLEEEKKYKEKNKKRVALIDALVAATEMTLPNILIESELDKMLGELKSQIENMRLKFEDYLTHLKKSEAELKSDWRVDAEKRVKTGLILEKISLTEKITPTPEAVTHEVEHLKKHYPEADPNRLAIYVTGHLTSDLTLEFLENLK